MVSSADELSSLISDLSAGHRLTLIDLTVTPTVYQVELDSLGIPRARQIPGRTISKSALDDSTKIIVIAHMGTEVPEYIRHLTDGKAYSRMRAPAGQEVRTALRDAMARSPTRQSYQLIVGRVDSERDRILLSSVELFPAGTSPGAVTELSVRNVCTEADGTVLAVAAVQNGSPQLLSVDSVRMEPGQRQIRAQLVDPGKVRFIKPDGALPDQRSWTELQAAVPSSLNGIAPCHVIWAVEVAGQPASVAARLYRVEEFIKAIHSQIPEPGQLKVSIVAYGTHRTKGKGNDDRVVVTDWMSAPGDAAKSLGKLGAANPSDDRTAQIEDALSEIGRLIRASTTKRITRLVIIGDGQPFPLRAADTVPRCPRGHNWEDLLDAFPQRLAIRDRPAGFGVTAWRRLGAGTVHALKEVDADSLARQLGLVVSALDHMPFPLAD